MFPGFPKYRVILLNAQGRRATLAKAARFSLYYGQKKLLDGEKFPSKKVSERELYLEYVIIEFEVIREEHLAKRRRSLAARRRREEQRRRPSRQRARRGEPPRRKKKVTKKKAAKKKTKKKAKRIRQGRTDKPVRRFSKSALKELKREKIKTPYRDEEEEALIYEFKTEELSYDKQYIRKVVTSKNLLAPLKLEVMDFTFKVPYSVSSAKELKSLGKHFEKEFIHHAVKFYERHRHNSINRYLLRLKYNQVVQTKGKAGKEVFKMGLGTSRFDVSKKATVFSEISNLTNNLFPELMRNYLIGRAADNFEFTGFTMEVILGGG